MDLDYLASTLTPSIVLHVELIMTIGFEVTYAISVGISRGPA